MPLRDIGGIASTFTVVDEFSDPLTRAEVMLRGVQRALDALPPSAAKWASAMGKAASVADRASQAMNALAGAGSRAAEAMGAALGITIDRAAEMNVALRRAATAFAPLRGGATAVANAWGRADDAIARSSGLLDSAGNKMAFAATAARSVAGEAAELAASALATSKAAAATATAISRARMPRLPAAVEAEGATLLPGGGGSMPPIRPPRRRGGGDEAFNGGGGVGGFIAGRASKIGSRIFAIPSLITGFAAYEAFKQALETKYHVTAGVELFDPAAINNPALLASDKARLSSLSFQTAKGTIFTAEQTAQQYDMLAAILATAPAFQGPNKWKNFSAIAPIILRASEVASMKNLGPLREDMIAMAWFAHLTGAYTPKAMTAASNQLLAISERTGVPLPHLEKIMSYALPISRGLGVNIPSAAMLVGALIQGGLGQRAGYAVGQMLVGLLQTGGPINATLQKALETLGPDAVKFTKGHGLSKHLQALHALGLMGPSGALTVLDKAGHIVLEKVVADIVAAEKHMTSTEFANALHSAFGIRGTRGAALLGALQKLIPAFNKSVADTPTAVAQQAAFAATTQQQLEQMVARMKDIGNLIATGVIPVLNNMLGVLVPILGDIDSFLGKHHRATSILGQAAAGAAVGGAFAGAPGALVGGVAGAVSGVVSTMTEPIPAQSLPANSPLRRLLHHDAFLISPRQNSEVNLSPTYNITVNAPHGAGGEEIGEHVRRALDQHTDAVIRAIQRQQRNTARGSMIDYGDAGAPWQGAVAL